MSNFSPKNNDTITLYTANIENWESILNDCDCACVEQSGIENFSKVVASPSLRDIYEFPENPVSLYKGLLILPVNSHFLIFNPAKGTFFVLNKLGHESMQSLRTPVKLNRSIKSNVSNSVDVLWQFYSILNSLGAIETDGKEVSSFLPVAQPEKLVVWLHLTNQCSLSCEYCYIKKSQVKMTQNTALRIVDKIFAVADLKGYKRVKLKYAGGEPTLEPDLLMQTQLYAEKLSQHRQLGLEATILTNGQMIPENLIAFSKSHHIKWSLSLDKLDAFRNKKSPASVTLSSLETLKSKGISPHVTITITKLNLEELPSLVTFLLHRQFKFSLNFYRENEGDSVDDLRPQNQELIFTMKKVYAAIKRELPHYSLLTGLLDRVDLRFPHIRPCVAGTHYFTVGTQGQIAPCSMLISQANEEITLETLSEQHLTFDSFQNPTVYEKSACRTDCLLYYYCAGGCPLDAHYTYKGNTPYCEVYRALAPEVLKLEALRLLKHEKPTNLEGFTDSEPYYTFK